MAIQSFSDNVTEKFFVSGKVESKAGWGSVNRMAKRKLDMLHYAANLNDLKVPPGNHLEALKGNLDGNFSIRINSQWRIVFIWTIAGPANVRIMDYH